MSKYITDYSKKITTENLEDAILKYQSALSKKDSLVTEIAYQKVVSLYDPLAFFEVWHKRYRFLYDTAEDFTQDYLRIFCNSLANWKPRNLRKESRYGGSGDFKNYFWGCLSHNMTNQLKASSAGKRSIAQRCPICEEWCGSLSTHVYESHASLLFDKLKEIGYEVDKLTDCPFCKSYKIPKDPNHDRAASVKKHLVSKHSSLIFERFHEIYPAHVTVAAKAISATLYDEDTGEEEFVYETTPSNPTLNALYSLDLNPLQLAIVECIIDGTVAQNEIFKELISAPDNAWEKLTEKQFTQAMSGLQDAMHIVGLDDGVNADE